MDADAAAGAEHRDGLAGLDLRAAEHLVGRGERVGDDADFGRMRLVVHALRQFEKHVRRQLYVLRIAAVAGHADHAGAAAGVLAQWFQIA